MSFTALQDLERCVCIKLLYLPLDTRGAQLHVIVLITPQVKCIDLNSATCCLMFHPYIPSLSIPLEV